MILDSVRDPVHIVGAGLAGLACAVRLVDAAYDGPIVIYEATGRAGGRAVGEFVPALGRYVETPRIILHSDRAAHEFLHVVESYHCLVPADLNLWRLGNPLASLPRLMLNTPVSETSPKMLVATALKGLAGIRPYIPKDSFLADFVEQAVRFLKRYRVKFRFNYEYDRTVKFQGRTVVALPAWFWDGRVRASPIVAAHYLADDPDPRIRLRRGIWIFPGKGVVTLRLNAAVEAARRNELWLGEFLWRSVYGGIFMPEFKVVKIPRATLWHGPRNRPNRACLPLPDPVLNIAGDWVEKGVPCSVESAVASGFRAADDILKG